MENEKPPIPSKFSQPIMWLAIIVVIFNVLLFLWSMKRDSEKTESSVPAVTE